MPTLRSNKVLQKVFSSYLFHPHTHFSDDKMIPHIWWAQQIKLLMDEVILQGWTIDER